MQMFMNWALGEHTHTLFWEGLSSSRICPQVLLFVSHISYSGAIHFASESSEISNRIHIFRVFNEEKAKLTRFLDLTCQDCTDKIVAITVRVCVCVMSKNAAYASPALPPVCQLQAAP